MKERDRSMTANHYLIYLMKTMPSSRNSRVAFTLTELCVVVAVVAVLVMLVLPALAAGKVQSASTGCLYNLRHLMVGWEMYRTENNDYLMPNAPLGTSSPTDPTRNATTWCSGAQEGWGPNDANTNSFYYTTSLMWRYVNNNLSVYRCPGDVVPSANGTRIRSYSMNGQLSASISSIYNPGYLVYFKGSDMVRPAPASLFVFADESPASLIDGFLQIKSSTNSPRTFPDIPACYLEGGCGFSFADGHGEIHRWHTSVLLIPVQYGVTKNNILAGSQNADWIWFTQHASSHQ